jgi:hypothetical protein
MLRIILVVAFAAISALAGAEVQAAGIKVFTPQTDLCVTEFDDPGGTTISSASVNYCLCQAALIWGKSLVDLESLYISGQLTIKRIDLGGVSHFIINYSGAEIILVEPL